MTIVKNAVDHLDLALKDLSNSREFGQKLVYTTDTHSFENWLRTEIAYKLSFDIYINGSKHGFWAFPEKEKRTDIPLCRYGSTSPEVVCEMKVLWNRSGRGEQNKKFLLEDKSKLLSHEGNKALVLIVVLVFMKYDDREFYPHLKRLDTIENFQDEVFECLSFEDLQNMKKFDFQVYESDWRPEFKFRICRLLISR